MISFSLNSIFSKDNLGFVNAIAPAQEALILTTPEITAIRDADRVAGLLEANEIYNDYDNFLNSCNKRSLMVEHKSKTHLFFEWANKLIHNDKIIDSVRFKIFFLNN